MLLLGAAVIGRFFVRKFFIARRLLSALNMPDSFKKKSFALHFSNNESDSFIIFVFPFELLKS